MPVLESLNWSLAARYDQYRYSGNSIGKPTWSTGLEWRPLDSLLVRGSYGTAFRAPALHYVYAGIGNDETSGNDYYYCLLDDADDCYYQYRRIGQERSAWGWSKISDIISWLSCGYGVRVSYTVFWCLFTILFFGVIFWAGKGMNKFEIEGMELPGDHRLRPSKRVSFTDALYFSIAMFTTSQAPVNTYPVGFYRHLAMAEGILGWFFLGLFVVVLSAVLIR